MDTKRYIPIEDFCASYEIDFSFVRSLNEYGLVEIITVEETPVIDKDYISELEKLVRLHTELKINLEGIDAISHLLHRVTGLQEEIMMLQNKLKRYED